MLKKIGVLLLIIVFLSHCKDNKPISSKILEKKELNITIQPFTDLEKSDAAFIVSELKKITPNVILKEQISLPKNAFYPPRNRYIADSIITFLASNTSYGSVTLGLTNLDISTGMHQKNWGIMGLGYRPGKSCIASSYRLSKTQKKEQFFKIAIHELGHTQGLPHCKEKTCFMRDAEGKNPTNEETQFCKNCKKFLTEKGWKLK